MLKATGSVIQRYGCVLGVCVCVCVCDECLFLGLVLELDGMRGKKDEGGWEARLQGDFILRMACYISLNLASSISMSPNMLLPSVPLRFLAHCQQQRTFFPTLSYSRWGIVSRTGAYLPSGVVIIATLRQPWQTILPRKSQGSCELCRRHHKINKMATLSKYQDSILPTLRSPMPPESPTPHPDWPVLQPSIGKSKSKHPGLCIQPRPPSDLSYRKRERSTHTHTHTHTHVRAHTLFVAGDTQY